MFDVATTSSLVVGTLATAAGIVFYIQEDGRRTAEKARLDEENYRIQRLGLLHSEDIEAWADSWPIQVVASTKPPRINGMELVPCEAHEFVDTQSWLDELEEAEAYADSCQSGYPLSPQQYWDSKGGWDEERPAGE